MLHFPLANMSKRSFDVTALANDAPQPKSRITSSQNLSNGLVAPYNRADTHNKPDDMDDRDEKVPNSRLRAPMVKSLSVGSFRSDHFRDEEEADISPVIPFDPMQFARPTAIPIHRERMRRPGGASGTNHTSKASLGLLQKAANSLYCYHRIKSDEVRLLVIKPAPDTPNDQLNATLMTVTDAQLMSDSYIYAALSYNWGDSDTDNTIIIQDDVKSRPITSLQGLVNGAMTDKGLRAKRLLIRPNLHEALVQLRRISKDKHLFIWVDALCINQNDEVEKQEQVKKMAHIYRNARNVCIWLGSDDCASRVSDLAMKFIPEALEPNNHQALLHDPQYIPKWASLFELLRWSW
jgi:hypothetical protein